MEESLMDDNMTRFEVLDSGQKEEMETGAHRDSRKGKGRFDLIPPGPTKRLALVYERGADLYGERNWEHGMKFSRLLDSAKRHINCFELGMNKEDHITQAIWNLYAIAHFQEVKPELNDLPKYSKDEGKYVPGIADVLTALRQTNKEETKVPNLDPTKTYKITPKILETIPIPPLIEHWSDEELDSKPLLLDSSGFTAPPITNDLTLPLNCENPFNFAALYEDN